MCATFAQQDFSPFWRNAGINMVSVERPSSEWFQEAARCYIEGHQACAWCGGTHRVFKLRNGSRTEYYCNDCEFLAAHDPDKEAYFFVPGMKSERPTPDTMCAYGTGLTSTH
jgi:hypothetical protein